MKKLLLAVLGVCVATLVLSILVQQAFGGGRAWANVADLAFGIGFLSIGLLALTYAYGKLAPVVQGQLGARTRAQAHDELLRLKKLLDEKLISQHEFDAKAAPIKARL